MDLEKTFSELKKAPKNEETIKSLKDLLKASEAENNKSLYMDILFYMIEILKYRKQHQEAIDLLEKIVNE